MPDDVPPSRVQEDEDFEQTPCDTSRDYNGCIQGFGAEFQNGYVLVIRHVQRLELPVITPPVLISTVM